MAQNNAWANNVLYSACSALSEPALWAARPGFFGSVGRTLNHIYEVDLFYLDALEQGGKGRAVYAREDYATLPPLEQAQAKADARFIAFAKGMNADDLHATRVTERPDGPREERLDWLVLHLVQHQVHHRGQVHCMLSAAGIDPPQLDDFYLEDGRVPSAAPFWE
ncbi:damage-inducible protein DinB [Amylibacter cionae]|uniref:Damage-inducible protein DinB n=2 Tax=Neptunicoccus cionae TaxID=2035344 RepID=A0A916VSR5_9RHOB|nr:damage-inducible protein DinB [Amylibacter cionae]